jgi:hypothetical protein
MTEIIPQEPGVTQTEEFNRLEQLAAGNVGDISKAMDTLSNDELSQLLVLEQAGKARITAIQAISNELAGRPVDGEPPASEPVSSAEPIGDNQTYAHLRASQVDMSGLVRPVLTIDGWLLPPPKASAE